MTTWSIYDLNVLLQEWCSLNDLFRNHSFFYSRGKFYLTRAASELYSSHIGKILGIWDSDSFDDLRSLGLRCLRKSLNHFNSLWNLNWLSLLSNLNLLNRLRSLSYLNLSRSLSYLNLLRSLRYLNLLGSLIDLNWLRSLSYLNLARSLSYLNLLRSWSDSNLLAGLGLHRRGGNVDSGCPDGLWDNLRADDACGHGSCDFISIVLFSCSDLAATVSVALMISAPIFNYS